MKGSGNLISGIIGLQTAINQGSYSQENEPIKKCNKY